MSRFSRASTACRHFGRTPSSLVRSLAPAPPSASQALETGQGAHVVIGVGARPVETRALYAKVLSDAQEQMEARVQATRAAPDPAAAVDARAVPVAADDRRTGAGVPPPVQPTATVIVLTPSTRPAQPAAAAGGNDALLAIAAGIERLEIATEARVAAIERRLAALQPAAPQQPAAARPSPAAALPSAGTPARESALMLSQYGNASGYASDDPLFCDDIP